MLKLKIKSVSKLFFAFIFSNLFYPNSIYVNNHQNSNWYLVSSYLMNEDYKDLYDYNFELRFSKKNIEFSYNYYVNKQNLLINSIRDNIFNISSFKYFYKSKNFIFGTTIKNYQNFKNIIDFYSISFILSKNFLGFDNTLDYYPYIEYEKGYDETLYFIPDYLYLGCVIKDGDVFVEPFIRINNINKEQYTGIKIGIEI